MALHYTIVIMQIDSMQLISIKLKKKFFLMYMILFLYTYAKTCKHILEQRLTCIHSKPNGC